jgi:hypothetical protein
MPDRPTLDQILCAITSLQGAAITLTEYARELATNPDAALSGFEEAPQAIAHALATTLDAMRQEPPCDDDTQLRGALARYLAGWVA